MNTKLLKKLCLLHSVVGDTQESVDVVKRYLKSIGVQSQQTGFGVLLCGNQKNPKALVSAHIDEVGFFVAKQNENKTFQIIKRGHVAPELIFNSKVYVSTKYGHIEGMVLAKTEMGAVPKNYRELYLDTLQNNKISIGDYGGYQKSFKKHGNKIISGGLDNKACVAILLEIIEKNPLLLKNNLFAFVTEEEASYDCIAGLADSIKPEWALVLDMTPVDHKSQDKVENIPQIGKGPAVLLATGKYNIHPQVKKLLDQAKLPFQPAIVELDFPPESQIVQRNGTTKGVNILLPMNGWHTTSYVMDKRDYEGVKTFTQKLLKTLST